MKTASETVSETRTASGDSSSSRTATQGPNVLSKPHQHYCGFQAKKRLESTHVHVHFTFDIAILCSK